MEPDLDRAPGGKRAFIIDGVASHRCISVKVPPMTDEDARGGKCLARCIRGAYLGIVAQCVLACGTGQPTMHRQRIVDQCMNAESAEHLGRYDRAGDLWTRCARDKETPETLLRAGLAYSRGNRHQAVIHVLGEYLKRGKSQKAKAHYLVGEAAMASGRMKLAKVHYQAVVAAYDEEQTRSEALGEFAAGAAYHLVELQSREFLTRTISHTSLGANLRESSEMASQLRSLMQSCNNVSRYGRPKWTAAATCQAGVIVDHAATVSLAGLGSLSTQVPAGHVRVSQKFSRALQYLAAVKYRLCLEQSSASGFAGTNIERARSRLPQLPDLRTVHLGLSSDEMLKALKSLESPRRHPSTQPSPERR